MTVKELLETSQTSLSKEAKEGAPCLALGFKSKLECSPGEPVRTRDIYVRKHAVERDLTDRLMEKRQL